MSYDGARYTGILSAKATAREELGELTESAFASFARLKKLKITFPWMFGISSPSFPHVFSGNPGGIRTPDQYIRDDAFVHCLCSFPCYF